MTLVCCTALFVRYAGMREAREPTFERKMNGVRKVILRLFPSERTKIAFVIFIGIIVLLYAYLARDY